MKKYYPVDFDEKGKVILGNAKDTPTSNGFIPTTWEPGGGSEDAGNGIKSITISPAISTTPALDSLFPIYWDDLPEDPEVPAGIKHFTASLTGTFDAGTTYTATVTPTSDWYGNGGGKGEPTTLEGYVEDGVLIFEDAVTSDKSLQAEKLIAYNIKISA